MTTPKWTAELAQIVAADRARWRGRAAGDGGWDWCILTAANERQAAGYRTQMRERERDGRWPMGMRWRVVADPGGRRIGSGLATLNALLALDEDLRDRKILILHCGGSSVRMPHCSAFGKIFAPLPVELAPGRASTILDENLALMNALAPHVGGGVLAASGDVLVAAGGGPDGGQFAPDRVTVVTVASPAATGRGHGVFVADRPRGRVRRMLQKCSPEVLSAAGAVDADGQVLIDTGIFYFPPGLVEALLGEVRTATSPLAAALARGIEVDLYTDFSEALSAETDRRAYTAAGGALRARLWELLHPWPLHIRLHSPGAFFHLGSTADYVHALSPESAVGRVYGLQRCVGTDTNGPVADATLVACTTAGAGASIGAGAVLLDCRVSGRWRVGREGLACGLGWGDGAVVVGEGLAAFAVPLKLDERNGWTTAVYGLYDNLKLPADAPGATFMNRPAAAVLAERGMAAEDLWQPRENRTLWHARLYPVEFGRATTRWLAWFQLPGDAAAWRPARRVSLAEIFEAADCEAMASRRPEV